MKVKDLQEILEQYGDNTNVYVRYHGFGIELDNEDTFKVKDIKEEYGDLVLSI